LGFTHLYNTLINGHDITNLQAVTLTSNQVVSSIVDRKFAGLRAFTDKKIKVLKMKPKQQSVVRATIVRTLEGKLVKSMNKIARGASKVSVTQVRPTSAYLRNI
jgi:hypothetical protein